MRTRRRLTWKVWVPTSFLGLTVIGLWVAWHATGMAEASSQYELQIAQARDLGMPTTIEEVRQRATADPSKNAARIYQPQLRHFEPGKSKTLDELVELYNLEFHHGLKDIEWRRAERLLKGMEAPLAQVTKASRMPDFDMRRRWELGFELVIFEIATYWSISKVLAVRSLCRSRQNNPMGALDDVETVIRFAGQLRREPIIAAVGFSLSVEGIAARHINEICNAHRRNPKVLERALSIVQSQKLPDLRPALGTEFAMLRDLNRRLASDPTSIGMRDPSMEALRLASVRRGALAVAMKAPLEVYRRYPSDPDDYEAVAKVLQDWDAEANADTSLSARLAGTFNMYGFYSWNAASFGVQVAQRRVQEAGLKLMLYQLQHRRLPEKLPFETKDPFSDAPLQYKRSANGFVVYSLGQDEKDDGGQPYNTVGRSTRDISWWFPKQPEKPPKPKLGPPPGFWSPPSGR